MIKWLSVSLSLSLWHTHTLALIVLGGKQSAAGGVSRGGVCWEAWGVD